MSSFRVMIGVAVGVAYTDRCGELLPPLPMFVFKPIFSRLAGEERMEQGRFHLAELLCNHFMEYSPGTGPLPPIGTQELPRAGTAPWKTLERVPLMDP